MRAAGATNQRLQTPDLDDAKRWAEDGVENGDNDGDNNGDKYQVFFTELFISLLLSFPLLNCWYKFIFVPYENLHSYLRFSN